MLMNLLLMFEQMLMKTETEGYHGLNSWYIKDLNQGSTTFFVFRQDSD